MNDPRYSELSDDQLSMVHTLCEVFECALVGGQPVSIESQMAAVSPDIQRPLFRELLAIELQWRLARSEPPGVNSFEARFPGHVDDIRQAFEELSEASANHGTPQSESGSWTASVFGQTHSTGSDSESPSSDSSPHLPDHIGRYRIEKVLGKGGFGVVYRARDEDLDRTVAVKVPHARLVSRPEDAEAYLAEARTVASLDHPNIIPVYDVGSNEPFPCYIVSKYVEGTDLASRLKAGRLAYPESARLVATIAAALHYAHKRGLVHRDVKPGNILVGKDGLPFIVDFGLALRDENIGKGARYAGTPAYMSPEQARGEGHRIDGRSDIFGLGVVFYEMLAGRRPFRGETHAEMLDRVIRYEPRPLRQHDETIPKELERICFKALSKRASQRYSSAYDMYADLKHFLDEVSSNERAIPDLVPDARPNDRPPPSPTPGPSSDSSRRTSLGLGSDSQPLSIVPRGLRSFDAHDADFFVKLLPGPYDRQGLPESLSFWKTRIEETDTDETFAVGLIYGPSGCGKSSLVKAGLLPRLATGVTPIYVEATATGTEMRLLSMLRKRCPGLPPGLNLKQALTTLRREPDIRAGGKLLIVLDQFEQWLHATQKDTDHELVEALRQCDGDQLQCLVLVPDGFWLAVSRFTQSLDIDLIPGRNISLVDLFDSDHAVKVLAAFGRAYGRLPENTRQTPAEGAEFLRQAVSDLADDGMVICIHLALFAEMMKSKPWTPATLKSVGGTEGVGVTFLEETFTAPTANPQHRRHQRAARAVLKALLPEAGSGDIKGHMRSYQELMEASGYQRAKDFHELVRILDVEIRLITPTDPEGMDEGGGVTDEERADPTASDASFIPHSSSPHYFQLTHDYLVKPLRVWLTHKQKETRRGRAELRLAERTAMWTRTPENRHLPAWWEYVNIRLFIPKKAWTETQQQTMRKAGRVQAVRWSSALVGTLLVAIALQYAYSTARYRNLTERTQTAVEAMSNARGVIVPSAIENLHELPREMVLHELRTRFAESETSEKSGLAYALADFGDVHVDFLVAQIETASNEEADNLSHALGFAKPESLEKLHAAAKATDSHQNWSLKQRLATVGLHMGDTSLAQEMCRVLPDTDPDAMSSKTQRLTFITRWSSWHGNVAQLSHIARTIELPQLRSGICSAIGSMPAEDVSTEMKQRWHSILVDWHQNDPDPIAHSAAGWALRRWQLKQPVFAVSRRPAAGSSWHVNSVGMTMLAIPSGSFRRRWDRPSRNPIDAQYLTAPLQEVTLTRAFLMSDREISVGVFQQMYRQLIDTDEEPQHWQYRDLEGKDPVHAPTDDHAAVWVNWNDAVLFCNWLSRKESLTPCYEPTDKPWVIPSASTTPGRFDNWRLVQHADGYRLPTDAEWEYACRAGAGTQNMLGDEVNSLIISVFGSSRSEIRGTKPPNSWGLFDMHGNVREWVQDWNESWRGVETGGRPSSNHGPTLTDPGGSTQNDGYLNRMVRKGIFVYNGVPLSVPSRDVGFRVARTLPP